MTLKGFVVVGGVNNVLEICAAEGRMNYAK